MAPRPQPRTTTTGREILLVEELQPAAQRDRRDRWPVDGDGRDRRTRPRGAMRRAARRDSKWSSSASCCARTTACGCARSCARRRARARCRSCSSSKRATRPAGQGPRPRRQRLPGPPDRPQRAARARAHPDPPPALPGAAARQLRAQHVAGAHRQPDRRSTTGAIACPPRGLAERVAARPASPAAC